MSEPMTAEQIENFRNVLAATIGPYAFVMSDEQVVFHRDQVQERMNELDKEKP